MRAVIFDWDLTLWNSWDIHLWLMERTAADLVLKAPTAGEVAAEFHRPFRQHLLWFFGSRYDAEDELDGIMEAYLAHYHRIVGHRNYLFPGAASLLRGLRRRGMLIGILSDKVPEFGDAELTQSGLSGLVDFASFKTTERPFKPDPVGLFQVLETLGVSASDAMYVGDAPQDVACARQAGVMSAAAMWATIDPQAIAEQGPDHLVHRPHQVMAVVANANGYEGSNPWLRHLPWPWRPDADDPEDDHDARPATPGAVEVRETNASWQYWPLAARWGGSSQQLAVAPEFSNPVAPLALRVDGG